MRLNYPIKRNLEDKGCWASPICKECKLDECVLDRGKKPRVDGRIQEARKLFSEGLSVLEISRVLGLHDRTVYRYTREVRDAVSTRVPQ